MTKDNTAPKSEDIKEQKQEPKKPVFIKKWEVMAKKEGEANKVYNVADVCKITDKNVLQFLFNNKYIK